MQLIRRAQERGRSEMAWLISEHSFSFAGYHDPSLVGFGPLRVINEDHVAPRRGFGSHPHRDMEILSYVVDGRLSHRDSMGNGSDIVPGEMQRMSAGNGLTHSEYNPSSEDPVHFLQIWIEPERLGLEPSYEQKKFADRRDNALCLVASRGGRGDSLTVHQDVDVYASVLGSHRSLNFELRSRRMIWVQMIRGELRVDGTSLLAGDGWGLVHAPPGGRVMDLRFDTRSGAEFLLFDCPQPGPLLS